MNDLISQAMAAYENPAQVKGVRIVNTVEPGVRVYADSNMTQSVLRNLIGNGIKYTPGGGEVRISASDKGSVVEIAVSDTGTGIPEQDRDKLFRTDIRYSCLGTDGEKGTGLGLILCREFVEKNGGAIWVESEPGKGSRFCFTLPKYIEP